MTTDVRAPKTKVCKACKSTYAPRTALQAVCSIPCSLALQHTKNAKRAEKASMEARRQQRERKASLKPRAFYVRQAQSAFNAFIRARDKDLPCVSCGRHHEGQYHAGHYRTTASQPALRFCEINCWKQCAPCNNNLSGDIVNYRKELKKRIGEDLLNWLEKDHPKTKPWTVEELKCLKRYYTKAAKQIKELEL